MKNTTIKRPSATVPIASRLQDAILMLMMALSVGIVQTHAQEGTIYLPPVEDPKQEIAQLESDLTPAERLRTVLADGNRRLADAIGEHKRIRTFESKDKVYALLAELAQNVIREIGHLESNEGRMRDNITQMIRKVVAVKQNVGARVAELADMSELAKSRVEELESELRQLARDIQQNPENENDLRRVFRRRLVMAKRLSKQHRAYGNHSKLHASFGDQLERVQNFLNQLDGNLDMLLEGLSEQRSLIVMRVQLLRDSAEVEHWLRDVGSSGDSVMAVATRLIGLQRSLDQFDAATDLIVEMNDVSDLIDMIPDISVIEGDEGDSAGLSAKQIEDRYIDHYLTN